LVRAETFDSRLAAWGGLIFVVLLYAGVFIGDVGLFGRTEPSWADGSGAAAASYFSGTRTALLVKCYLTPLAAVALLPFLVHLRVSLRGPEGQAAVAADAAAAAGLLGAAFYMAVVSFEGVGAFRAPISGVEARLLLDASTAFFVLNWFAFGAMGLAAAAATFRAKTLPRWLAFVALAFGLIYLVGPIALPSELGVSAPFVLAVWIIAVAIIWLRRAGGIRY